MIMYCLVRAIAHLMGKLQMSSEWAMVEWWVTREEPKNSGGGGGGTNALDLKQINKLYLLFLRQVTLPSKINLLPTLKSITVKMNVEIIIHIFKYSISNVSTLRLHITT
jgi:hypothetical protein